MDAPNDSDKTPDKTHNGHVCEFYAPTCPVDGHAHQWAFHVIEETACGLWNTTPGNPDSAGLAAVSAHRLGCMVGGAVGNKAGVCVCPAVIGCPQDGGFRLIVAIDHAKRLDTAQPAGSVALASLIAHLNNDPRLAFVNAVLLRKPPPHFEQRPARPDERAMVEAFSAVVASGKARAGDMHIFEEPPTAQAGAESIPDAWPGEEGL